MNSIEYNYDVHNIVYELNLQIITHSNILIMEGIDRVLGKNHKVPEEELLARVSIEEKDNDEYVSLDGELILVLFTVDSVLEDNIYSLKRNYRYAGKAITNKVKLNEN